MAHKRATEKSWGGLREEVLSLLCHFSNAVHVESRNLLGHHAAHGQLQLQQRRSKPVVLEMEVEQSQGRVCEHISKHHCCRSQRRGEHKLNLNKVQCVVISSIYNFDIALRCTKYPCVGAKSPVIHQQAQEKSEIHCSQNYHHLMSNNGPLNVTK